MSRSHKYVDIEPTQIEIMNYYVYFQILASILETL